MRVLCGQCGHVNKLDDGYALPTVACEKCGRGIPVAPLAEGPPAGAEEPAPPPEDAEAEAEELGFAEQARRSEHRKVEITCPNCGKTVSVSARVAGRKARCKACDHALEIPWPDDLEEFQIAPLDRADAHENGLELVAPMEEELPGPPPPPEPEQVESELELTAVSDEEAQQLAEQLEAAPHDPVAELAAVHPGAELEALERQYQPEELQPPAPPEDAGELVSAVESFRDDKRIGRAARAEPSSGAARRLRWVLLLVAACLAVGAALAIVLPMLPPDEPEDDITVGVGPTQPAPASRTAAHVGWPETRSVAPPPVSPVVAQPPAPACKVLSVTTDAFAVGDYHPAPADSVYWKVAAEITAGKEPLSFDARGRDVRLVFGDERFASLGVPAGGGSPLPARSRPLAVRLKPNETRKVTFLFQAPSDLTKGGLFIRGVAYVDVALAAPRTLSPRDLAGTYLEKPPRHLKPLLRDPVMAAIQAATRQRVIVAPAAGDGTIEVAIPEARVRGVGRQIAPGLFQTPLRHGDAVLGALVRFVDQGRRLILYLADQPFHQLTYVNPDAKPPPAPKPPGPATVATAKTRPSRPAKPTGPVVTGPPLGKSLAQPLGFDPNKPDPNENIRLPTGRSIFD